MIARSLPFTAFAVAGLVTCPHFAVAQNYQSVQPNIVFTVGCALIVVSQTSYVMVHNPGSVPIPAGTRVHWSIAALGMQGDYALTAPLAVGKTVHAAPIPYGAALALVNAKPPKAAPCVASTGVQRRQ